MNEMKPEVKAYFDTLPKNVQTSVIESGAKFHTVEQLKVVAKAYMQGKEKFLRRGIAPPP